MEVKLPKKGEPYRKKENLKRFFYPKEWNAFYESVPENLRFYYNFLLQTGCRYVELKHVEVRDIDFSRNSVEIRFAKTRIGSNKKVKIQCESCKNNIRISAELKFCPICGKELENIAELIKEHRAKIETRRRELRKVKISKKFAGELKGRIAELGLNKSSNFNFPTIQHLNQTMKQTLKTLNVSDWQDFSPHNIRKTLENYLLATGSNPLSMRSHMGHSIDVASAHYISSNVFTDEEIGMIRMIIGNLIV